MRRILPALLFSFFLPVVLSANQGIFLANDYQQNSGLQWQWAIDGLRKFAFNPADQVLDVGCGDGKITALIARHVSEGTVIGLDISESMIRHASLNHKKDNLTFLRGDAIDIPFKERFDKVVSFCTLHWVLDQQQALESMKASLKENGALLLVVPGKSPNNVATLYEAIAKSEKWSMYFPDFKPERVYFSKEEYVELVQKADLEIQSVEEMESITLFKDKAALIRWITPLINFIDHLSLDLQNSFIEEIADAMLLNTAPLADGSIPVQHVKIELVAVKH